MLSTNRVFLFPKIGGDSIIRILTLADIIKAETYVNQGTEAKDSVSKAAQHRSKTEPSIKKKLSDQFPSHL